MSRPGNGAGTLEQFRQQLDQVAKGQLPPESAATHLRSALETTQRRRGRVHAVGYTLAGIVSAVLGYGSTYLSGRDADVERRVRAEIEAKQQADRVQGLEQFRGEATAEHDQLGKRIDATGEAIRGEMAEGLGNVRAAIDAAHPSVRRSVPRAAMMRGQPRAAAVRGFR